MVDKSEKKFFFFFQYSKLSASQQNLTSEKKKLYLNISVAAICITINVLSCMPYSFINIIEWQFNLTQYTFLGYCKCSINLKPIVKSTQRQCLLNLIFQPVIQQLPHRTMKNLVHKWHHDYFIWIFFSKSHKKMSEKERSFSKCVCFNYLRKLPCQSNGGPSERQPKLSINHNNLQIEKKNNSHPHKYQKAIWIIIQSQLEIVIEFIRIENYWQLLFTRPCIVNH